MVDEVFSQRLGLIPLNIDPADMDERDGMTLGAQHRDLAIISDLWIQVLMGKQQIEIRSFLSYK